MESPAQTVIASAPQLRYHEVMDHQHSPSPSEQSLRGDDKPASRKVKSRNRYRKRLWAVSLLLLLGTGLAAFVMTRSSSPVPGKIAKEMSFPVYYPDQKAAPSGYNLDPQSFKTPQKDVVLYTVKHGGEEMIFSIQPKPADQEIQKFYANYIPLRNQMQTPLGQAEIGAYGQGKDVKTVVSLPVADDNSWIIITAPYAINQDQLKQVLISLKK